MIDRSRVANWWGNQRASLARNKAIYLCVLSWGLICFGIGFIGVVTFGNLLVAVGAGIGIDVGLLIFSFVLATRNLRHDDTYKRPTKIWAELGSAMSVAVAATLLLSTANFATKAFDDAMKATTKPQALLVEHFQFGPQTPRTTTLEKGDQLTVDVPPNITVPSEKDAFALAVAWMALPFASIAAGLKIALAFAEKKSSKKQSLTAPLDPIAPILPANPPPSLPPQIPVTDSAAPSQTDPSPIIFLCLVTLGVVCVAIPARKRYSRRASKQ